MAYQYGPNSGTPIDMDFIVDESVSNLWAVHRGCAVSTAIFEQEVTVLNQEIDRLSQG